MCCKTFFYFALMILVGCIEPSTKIIQSKILKDTIVDSLSTSKMKADETKKADSIYIKNARPKTKSFNIFDFRDDYFSKMMHTNTISFYSSEQFRIKQILLQKNEFPADEYKYINIHPKTFAQNWHLLFGYTKFIREEVLLCIVQEGRIVDIILLAGSYGDGEVYDKTLSTFDPSKSLFKQVSYQGIYLDDDAGQKHIDTAQYSTLNVALFGITEIQTDSVKHDFIIK